ncbi:glutaredoxin [Mycobacterium phage Phabba]|uniref:Glutaredoxin n=1 Tax=Mycobacterium phage Phabba TaxID=2027899 RepID=A0A249XSF8_9CAUD|nr:glutaredoxin [Mycobacterium phage Phabba]ASZ74658.1 glutaredoxin [Mycobacterium phage Phabba]
MAVTLYSKPSCPGCDMSVKLLDKEGIPFEKVDITVDEDAYKHVTETLGYSAAPVIQWENAEGTVGGHFTGFNPDKIREIKKYS